MSESQFVPIQTTDLTDHSRPLVSIVIRTKNRNALLRQALASVLAQTYPNLEVIVVNDGGEDSTPVIDEFQPNLTIHHILHDNPRGRAAAANTGLQATQGKYINFLDDDDLLYADHIEKLATFLESSGESFAYSDCDIGHYQWQDQDFLLKSERQLFNGFDFDRDRLYFNNYIATMTAMFTRQLWEQVGLLDESLDCLEDWDLWLRMAGQVTFHHLPGVTAEYRSLVNRDYDNRYWTLKIYDKYRDYWSPENLAKQTWPRIEALQTENIELRTEVTNLQAQLRHTQQVLDFIQNSFSWRLSRFVPGSIRGFFRQALARLGM
jgi:glycosyltransferase involved in cell wall biosynthesis